LLIWQLKEFTCETKTRTSISIYEPASPLHVEIVVYIAA
jgi:hypothetical protein